MYALLVGSGILITVEPSQLVIDQLGSTRTSIWGVFWSLGAAICFYGAFSDRWIGEYSGIPLLGSVIGLYGLSALYGGVKTDSVLLFAFGLLILGFAFGLHARWRDVQSIVRANNDVARMHREDKGGTR